MRRFALFCLLVASAASAEMKVMPVASLSLLGGQYFLDGQSASFGGRADAFLSPVVRLSEGHELVPVYSGNYSGTQDVQELAGGGVLTRQRMTHTGSLAYVYRREFDKYQPRLSYSKALVRETTDEKWGKGLFDAETLSAGIAAEHERWWGTVTESYDFYTVRYPNYSTLLSESSVALDSTTYSELSQNAGSRVLDNQNQRLGLGLLYYWEPLALRGSYDFTHRRYPDQAVVDSVGAFKSARRVDLVQNLTLKAIRDLRPAQLALTGRLGLLDSNQNNYDASRTQYVGDYHGYREFALAPSLALAFKNGGGMYFETGWTQRLYSGRLAQAADGAYSASRIHQTLWLTTLSLRTPVYAKRLFLRLAASYQSSASNMKYEAGYRYNYQANNYALGLEWEL